MSVSSHLTPEPERRLWLILEQVRGEAERAEWKLAALAALAAAEIHLGAAASAGRFFLGLVIVAGILAFLPSPHKAKRLPLLDPPFQRPSIEDSLISIHDIPKYSYGELVLKLDRYLGGGITATQYYEDIIAEIGAEARRAARKRRLLFAVAGVFAFVQAAIALA